MEPGVEPRFPWHLKPWLDQLPTAALIAAYGLARAGVLVWHPGHGGLLGFSRITAGAGAAVQAFALAGLVLAERGRRRALGWVIAALGVVPAVADAALWVVVGSGDRAVLCAWGIVLAAVAGIAALLLCRTGFGWVSGTDGRADWPPIIRALWHCAGAAAVTAATFGLAAALIRRPVTVDRLARLLAMVGGAAALNAILTVLPMIGEQRGEIRDAQLDDIYARINEGREPNDDSE